MKVLQLVKTSEGATWAFRQMRELIKLGIEVHVAIPTDGPLIIKYLEAGIVVHELNYSLNNIIRVSNHLRSIVKEVQPDIIHSHFVLTTIIMRLALRGVKTPRIFQVPGPLHLENIFFRNIEIMLAQKCDFWVGSCKWTNTRYEKSGVNKNRLYLSYYGTDIQDLPRNKGKLRSELGLKNSDIIVGMVAYMYAPKKFLGQKRGLKGHEDFIDAISIISKNYPNVYGVCIGGAWNGAVEYEKKVINYGKSKTDHIIFLGTRSDVNEIYPDFFCVAHPSLSENLGGAAESLLLGIPTIATNIGGFTDIVKHGETGLIVPPFNPELLAQAIIQLIEGSFNVATLSQNGKNLVSKMLDVRETALTIKYIYDDVIQK